MHYEECLRLSFDTCQKHICVVKSVGLKLNEFSESLLTKISHKKLDIDLRKQYELLLVISDLLDWKIFIDLSEKCCLMLENVISGKC